MNENANDLSEQIVQNDKVRSLNDILTADATPEDMIDAEVENNISIDIQTITVLFQDLNNLLDKLLNENYDSIKLYNTYAKYNENINRLKDIIDQF